MMPGLRCMDDPPILFFASDAHDAVEMIAKGLSISQRAGMQPNVQLFIIALC